MVNNLTRLIQLDEDESGEGAQAVVVVLVVFVFVCVPKIVDWRARFQELKSIYSIVHRWQRGKQLF